MTLLLSVPRREMLWEAMDTIVSSINSEEGRDFWYESAIFNLMNDTDFCIACDTFKATVLWYVKNPSAFSPDRDEAEEFINAFVTISYIMEMKEKFQSEVQKIRAYEEEVFRTEGEDYDPFPAVCNAFICLMKGWFDPAVFNGIRKRYIVEISPVLWDVQMYDCMQKLDTLSDSEVSRLLDVPETSLKSLRSDARAYMQRVFEQYTSGPGWRARLMDLPERISVMPDEIRYASRTELCRWLKKKYGWDAVFGDWTMGSFNKNASGVVARWVNPKFLD